ncbi:MAG: guanylate kinase [Candidatus Xenolissoclinum pacificiensis L6]|uniref:Guanylate kinase n=1 Tax=Candidatus Xenolissoclinum pacificiensis L6 TaxID=1401685 RepID=W2UZ24_9RICK|nr:MAG: guanylate kinase [Candidatus Xenolissoclinum pacificiensis L6]
MRKGKLFVISAPSGCGKTTVVNRVLSMDDKITRSISMTTRCRRGYEVNGEDYFFVTREVFKQYVTDGKMLEYAVVFDQLYGTPMDYIKDQMDKGVDVICSIDWQGGYQIHTIIPDAVLILLLPPSLEELYRRLSCRASDSVDEVNKRIKQAKHEIVKSSESGYLAGYVVVNDTLDDAVHQVLNILYVERSNRWHKIRLREYLNSCF